MDQYHNETHPHLPVTEHVLGVDPAARHVEYSRINLRAESPC